MSIRIARSLHGTIAEGPGRRTAVWFQGCSIRCRGCVNPHLFRADGGIEVDPETIVASALAFGDEGLTLIGGEPFDQASGAAQLASSARAEGLGVITFTGYLVEALRERDDGSRALLAATDLLIDGPYDADRPETVRPLVGSTNQRLHHLTDRYRSAFATGRDRNRIEIRVGSDGTVNVAGFTGRDGVRGLRRAVGVRAISPGAVDPQRFRGPRDA